MPTHGGSHEIPSVLPQHPAKQDRHKVLDARSLGLTIKRMMQTAAVSVSYLLLIFSALTPVPTNAQVSAPNQAAQTLQQFVDQVFLMVTPIEMWSGPSKLGTATGFFFENGGRLFLVTNRHVVRIEDDHVFPNKLRIRLHTNLQDLTENEDYDVALYRNNKSVWKETPGVDLVAIEVPKADMTRFVLIALSPRFLPPDDLVISAGDEVMVVGYPLGFSDTVNNYPVVRTGAVASRYLTPFQGKPFFVVDARLHPGTSGSPVLTIPRDIARRSGATEVGTYHFFFLGVNSGEFGGLGLNAIWYAKEVVELTSPNFQSASFPQP